MLSLKALMEYLQLKRLATAEAIAQAFSVEIALVRHMLQRLIKNGCVVCVSSVSACSTGCSSCVFKCQEVYQLV